MMINTNFQESNQIKFIKSDCGTLNSKKSQEILITNDQPTILHQGSQTLTHMYLLPSFVLTAVSAVTLPFFIKHKSIIVRKNTVLKKMYNDIKMK